MKTKSKIGAAAPRPKTHPADRRRLFLLRLELELPGPAQERVEVHAFNPCLTDWELCAFMAALTDAERPFRGHTIGIIPPWMRSKPVRP